MVGGHHQISYKAPHHHISLSSNIVYLWDKGMVHPTSQVNNNIAPQDNLLDFVAPYGLHFPEKENIQSQESTNESTF